MRRELGGVRVGNGRAAATSLWCAGDGAWQHGAAWSICRHCSDMEGKVWRESGRGSGAPIGVGFEQETRLPSPFSLNTSRNRVARAQPGFRHRGNQVSAVLSLLGPNPVATVALRRLQLPPRPGSGGQKPGFWSKLNTLLALRPRVCESALQADLTDHFARCP